MEPWHLAHSWYELPVPPGLAVRVHHRGSHEHIYDDLAQLKKWVIDHGFTPIAHPFELVIQGLAPLNLVGYAEWETDLVQFVAPANT